MMLKDWDHEERGSDLKGFPISSELANARTGSGLDMVWKLF
jgi:hypothetical protein